MKITDDAIKMRSGTSLRGYIYAQYEQLIELFGEPYDNPDNHKTDTEWVIATPYGPATIYNYKNGQAYLGRSGMSHTEIKTWHVGGRNGSCYDWVMQHIDSPQSVL